MLGVGMPYELRGSDEKNAVPAEANSPELLPADALAIKSGDPITHVNGQPVKAGGKDDEFVTVRELETLNSRKPLWSRKKDEITKDEYDKLSKLAPVVAYPKVAYGTSWQDSLETIGKALGRTAKAKEVEATTVASLDAAKARYPQLAGKTFIYGYIAPTDMSQIGYYTPSDLRPQMLTELGMKNAPVVEEGAKGTSEFYLTVSSEKAASMQSDIFLSYITEDSEVGAMKKDPLIGQVPAIKAGALVATKDQKVGLTMSSPTPLSIPYMTQLFVPLIAAAADKADGA
jgi:iron complex transport system substrate-binding protein